MINKQIIKQLEKIARKYIKLYKLKVIIDIIEDYAFTSFNLRQNSIIISLKHVDILQQEGRFINRFKQNNKQALYILALLHEIKHVIDYQVEQDAFNQLAIAEDNISHDKRKLEINADIFANKEYKTASKI